MKRRGGYGGYGPELKEMAGWKITWFRSEIPVLEADFIELARRDPVTHYRLGLMILFRSALSHNSNLKAADYSKLLNQFQLEDDQLPVLHIQHGPRSFFSPINQNWFI